MMKRITLLSLFIFCVSLLSAQYVDTRVVPKISALTPGIGVEIPLFQAWSVQIMGSVPVRAEVASSPNFIQTQLIVEPQVSIQPRYYFDLYSRAAAKKDVRDFSADFFVLDLNFGRALTQTGNFNRLVVNPGIGLQRSFGRRGYISLHAGPSVTLGPALLVQGRWLRVAGQVNLGWRLGQVQEA